MRLKASLVILTLTLTLGVPPWLTSCALIASPVPREFILIKPGDPVWLVKDVKGAHVLGKVDGKMVYGKADLKAGCCVWYDQKWNDTTLPKPAE